MKVVGTIVMVMLLGCASAPAKPEVVPDGGVGVVFRLESNTIAIDKIATLGPAAGAGITHRDALFAIDGVSVQGPALADVIAKLSGPVGSSVTLRVGRTADDARDVVVVRQALPPEKRECTGNCDTGNGVSIDSFGERYEGEFVGGRYHGQGWLTDPSGGSYKGGFVDGLASGAGVYSDGSGARFEGTFERGNPVGDMKVTRADGLVYEGAVVQGFMMTGVGKLSDPRTGDVWSGVFEFDRLVEGKWLHYPEGGDGRTCERAVSVGQVAKTGIITYAPKDKKKRLTFDGPFADDCVANGEGLMTYKGRKLLGFFINDEPKQGAKVVK